MYILNTFIRTLDQIHFHRPCRQTESVNLDWTKAPSAARKTEVRGLVSLQCELLSFYSVLKPGFPHKDIICSLLVYFVVILTFTFRLLKLWFKRSVVILLSSVFRCLFQCLGGDSELNSDIKQESWCEPLLCSLLFPQTFS